MGFVNSQNELGPDPFCDIPALDQRQQIAKLKNEIEEKDFELLEYRERIEIICEQLSDLREFKSTASSKFQACKRAAEVLREVAEAELFCSAIDGIWPENTEEEKAWHDECLALADAISP